MEAWKECRSPRISLATSYTLRMVSKSMGGVCELLWKKSLRLILGSLPHFAMI